MKEKDNVLIIIAVILTILICWGNFRALFNTGSWINAGLVIIVLSGIVIFLHAILLFILIRTAAMKLPLGYIMAIWMLVVFIYVLPMLISHRNQLELKKQAMAEQSAKKRISEGVATIDDFTYLYKDDDKNIIINTFRNGYNDIAIQVLNTVCDPKSDRIFGNYSLRLSYVEKYGKDILCG